MRTSELYNHAEAFCLMHYVGDVSGRAEVLWNSRDGVTPFVIVSNWGGRTEEPMAHRVFSMDRRVPTYVPPVGSRIFVDLTPERARERARLTAESFLRMRGEVIDEEEIFKGLMVNVPGAPDIVVVDEAIHRRFQARFNEIAFGGAPPYR